MRRPHTFTERRSIRVEDIGASPFTAICRVLRGQIPYRGRFLWQWRGAIDRMLGGNVSYTNHGDCSKIASGELLGVWRVHRYISEGQLELSAEAQLPGNAELVFVFKSEEGKCGRILMINKFRPNGLTGRLYWHMLLPLHRFVFDQMLQAIAREQGSDRSFTN